MKYIILLLFLTNITTFAQNKRAFLRDGNNLYKDSLYNDAEMKYRKSLEKDQDYIKASFNMADAIYKQNRYDESSLLFNALKDNTSDPEILSKIHHNLGNSLFKEQKFDQAINAYKDALRLNPADHETRHNLALAQQKENQQQEQKENQQQEQKEKMSKEDAEKMLEAIQQEEKELQKELQKKKTKGSKNKILKDW